MASAYISNTDEITQEDLNRFYENIGEESLIPNDYNIEDFSDDDSPNIISDSKLSRLNDTINDTDSEDLDYQLKLYAEGRLDDLSKILEEGDKKENNKKEDNKKQLEYKPLTSSRKNLRQTKQQITSKRVQLHKNNARSHPHKTLPPQKTISHKTSPLKNLRERPPNNKERYPIHKEEYGVELIMRHEPKQNSIGAPKSGKSASQQGNVDALKYLSTTVDVATDNHSSNTPTRPAIGKSELNDMQSIMKSWLEIDDEIKEVSKIIRTLRDKKKALTEDLLQDMNQYKVGILSEGTQQLKYAVSYTKQGYKKDFIKDKLTEYLKDESMAEKIADYLEESREKKEKVDIRRGKVRGSKK